MGESLFDSCVAQVPASLRTPRVTDLVLTYFASGPVSGRVLTQSLLVQFSRFWCLLESLVRSRFYPDYSPLECYHIAQGVRVTSSLFCGPSFHQIGLQRNRYERGTKEGTKDFLDTCLKFQNFVPYNIKRELSK